MAIWEFKVSLVPTLGILRVHRSIPQTLEEYEPVAPDCVDLDNPLENYWDGVAVSPEIITKIERRLPRIPSWSSKALMFGNAEASQVIIWPNDFVIKVDLRNPWEEILAFAAAIAQELDCKIVPHETGDIMDPNLTELYAACVKSRAYKFIQNPKRTLESLKTKPPQTPPKE